MCGGRRNNRRQQRAAVALTLLQAVREHQQKKQVRGLLPAASTSTSPVMTQNPMYRGVVDRSVPAELPSQDIPSHPPTYDEAVSPTDIPFIDEKQPSYRTAPLVTEIPAPLPPHEFATQVDRSVNEEVYYAAPRSNKAPLDNLLDSITNYFETQMRLHEDQPWKVRKFEAKKQRKLEKMDRKFADQLEKGSDNMDHLHRKMAKKAAKMEKWTVWALERSARQDAYSEGRQRGCCGRRQRAGLVV